MSSLIKQIRKGKLWDFHGGVHPPENKSESSQQAIATPSLYQHYVIPTKQHLGHAGQLLVKVNDKVLKGQALTKAEFNRVVPVHAPTSGTVVAIENRPINHPSGLTDLCIVIKADGLDTWAEKNTYLDYQQLAPKALIEHIHQAGIAGLGGAGFPAHNKLAASLDSNILIINAAECEPYITADDKLMQDFADELVQGIQIIEHITKPDITVIGIEDNKPQAILALKEACQETDMVIRVIPTKYPSGASKQLVQILTGREIPHGKHSSDVGILMHNVGTAFAIKRAIIDGEPLIERIVTLAGKTFTPSLNVIAKLGTSIADLLAEFAPKKNPQRLIIGGSLMGYTLPHANIPVTKITNCIIAPIKGEVAEEQNEMPCIRCSDCAAVCPANLLPQQLLWYAKSQEYGKCEEYSLEDCIECGACAYVCPSEIPLVQYYRQAKAQIYAQQQEAYQAELARQRFEDRKERLEREKQERAERFKQAADKRRQEMKATGGDDAVAAAIARVKAQKQAKEVNEDQASTQKPAVAAAIARAKAKREAAQNHSTPVHNASDHSEHKDNKTQDELTNDQTASQSKQVSTEKAKNPAVAAAIARAKAKREAVQSHSTSDHNEPKDNKTQDGLTNDKTASQSKEVSTEKAKNPAVATAIARAKAKREAAQKQAQPEIQPTAIQSTSDQSTSAQSAPDQSIAKVESPDVAQANDNVINSEQQADTAKSNHQNSRSQQENKQAAHVQDLNEKINHPEIETAIARAKAKLQASLANQASVDKTSAEQKIESSSIKSDNELDDMLEIPVFVKKVKKKKK